MGNETSQVETSFKPQPNASKQEKPSSDFETLLSEAVKHTVFSLFVLYLTGFLIWHSHLAAYGVASLGFLQTEYISAAFCYLFLTITFGIPPALLVSELLMSKEKRKTGNWLVFLAFMWLLLFGYIRDLYFPQAIKGVSVIRIAKFTCGAMVLYVFAIIICRWKFKKLLPLDFLVVFVVAHSMLVTILKPQADLMFFLITLCHGCFLGFLWRRIHLVWKDASQAIRSLTLVAGVLFLLWHVQLFGKVQFIMIPREVGGGQPEKAYLKFSSESKDLPSLLSIPAATNLTSVSGFFGPVSILLRSEKDILFVNYTDFRSFSDRLRLPEFQTRVTTNILSTNSLTSVTTILRPNEIKQLRADLVDVVIYEK